MDKIEIILPCRILLRKRKKDGKLIFFNLNLNDYRNTHYRTLAEAKVKYAEKVKERLIGVNKMKKLELTYELFMPNKRRIDINNVLTIVDKFFVDVLVSEKIIPDDCYKNIEKTTFLFGGISNALLDKAVRVIITPLS